MPVQPVVPEELTHGPFTVVDALRAGLSRRQLQSRCWKRLGNGIYLWNGVDEEPQCVLEAASRRLPPEAAFSGRTAGWLHGLDLEPCRPIEATLPVERRVATRAGVLLHRAMLPRAEVVICRGVAATSPVRTVFDLARHLPLREAVVAVDMALNRDLVRLASLSEYVAGQASARGRAQARRVVDLADPGAESPMESRLRLLLVTAGLPRPATQAELADRQGRFLGRVDLYYRDQRLAIEYDGAGHRDRLVADNRRQNRLLAAGYRLLRFAAGDLTERPGAVVAEVRAALGQ